MRIPSSVQGLIFAPTLICLFFILKAFCPDSAGDSCFADQFAVPIFLPLVAIYKIFGDTSVVAGQEFLLIMVYWAFIGFLVGLILDLWRHTGTQEIIMPDKPLPISPLPTALSNPVQHAPSQNMQVVRPVIPQPIVAPPASLPLMKKPPINLLDREEYKSKP